MSSALILTILDVTLLAVAVTVAVAVVRTTNLMTATVLMAVYSLLMALMYLVLGAPDVAMTEAAVGAGISTVLTLAALSLVGEKEKKRTFRIAPLIVVALLVGTLVYATFDMPRFGDAANITNNHITAYYLARTESDMGIPNVVTAILASYRGYDTLGETFVVFTAALSVSLLLNRPGERRKGLSDVLSRRYLR